MNMTKLDKRGVMPNGDIKEVKEEVWKDVVGYEGYYQVSNLGNVKSVDRYVSNNSKQMLVKGRLMNLKQDKKGYLRVNLSKNNHVTFTPVHRLVAMAFIPNLENKPQVNHIDGVKTNNNVSNLEWVTNLENMQHAVRSGLFPYAGPNRNINRPISTKVSSNGTTPGKQPKAVLQIDPITNEVIAEHMSIAEAARAVGVKVAGNIGGCCKGLYGRNTIKGYKWKYKEVMSDGYF